MTGAEIASIVGSGLSGAGGIAGAITSGVLGQKNLDFMKEQYEYQKQLNAQYLDRQDNRLQYLKKDADKAGVNLLAALGNGAQYSPLQAGTAPRQDAPMIAEMVNALGSLAHVGKTMQDIKTAKSVENLNSANTSLMGEQAKVQGAMLDIHKQNLDYARRNRLPVGVLPTTSQVFGELGRDLRLMGKHLDEISFNPFSLASDFGYKSIYSIDNAIDKFTTSLMDRVNEYFNNDTRRRELRRKASGRY